MFNKKKSVKEVGKKQIIDLGPDDCALILRGTGKSETVCTLKGKWTSWDFKFMRDTEEYAHVSKKWAGIGKELFTTADNYMLKINDNVSQDNPLRILILAAVVCIDMVLKE